MTLAESLYIIYLKAFPCVWALCLLVMAATSGTELPWQAGVLGSFTFAFVPATLVAAAKVVQLRAARWRLAKEKR